MASQLGCILSHLTFSASTLLSIVSLNLIGIQSWHLMVKPFDRFINKVIFRMFMVTAGFVAAYLVVPIIILSFQDGDIRAFSSFCMKLPLVIDNKYYAHLVHAILLGVLIVSYIVLFVANGCVVRRMNQGVVISERSKKTRNNLIKNMFAVLVTNMCGYLALVIVDILGLLEFGINQTMLAVLLGVILPIAKVANPLIYNILNFIRNKKQEMMRKPSDGVKRDFRLKQI